jgi:hypothetical protein
VLELARSTFQATADDLARKAGGVTAYMRAPAKGLWRKRGARLERDYIVVYEVMVKSLRRREWRMRRKDLERTFRQDEMVIRVLPLAVFPIPTRASNMPRLPVYIERPRRQFCGALPAVQ